MADLYRMYDSTGQLLYIGQSISLAERLGQHRAGSSFWPAVRTITIEAYPDASAARLAEARAIAAERPIHNRVGVSPPARLPARRKSNFVRTPGRTVETYAWRPARGRFDGT